MKKILNFEGYLISERGGIFSKKSNKYLKPFISSQGYLRVALSKNGKRTNHSIHVLVAETYIGMRPQGLVIDHIDGDRMNNFYKNLRYVTVQQNTYLGESVKFSISYDGKCFPTISSLSRKLSCSKGHIDRCLKTGNKLYGKTIKKIPKLKQFDEYTK